MKKVTSALALAALIGSPAAMANVEFGGDADAGFYSTQGSGSQETGFEQRIRLQSAFETDGGVSVHARMNLINDRWTGDGSGNAGDGLDERSFTAGNRGHRNVELDYGYVSMPVGFGQLNVGRQMSNWNNDFTTSDDRRDRISMSIPLGGGHVFAPSYDRRTAPSTTDRELDGNQLNLALLGPLAPGVNYGFLVTGFEAGGADAGDAGYALRGAGLVAPYIAGETAGINYQVGGHYFGGSRGALFTEDTFGGYVSGGFELTPEFGLEAQAMYADGGTLVSGGYDTYSSLIHNSPDHDQSATRIAALNLGGGGTEAESDHSRTLVATRGTFTTMDWTFYGSLGYVDYDFDVADEDIVFADLQAHYALTESTTIYGTAGYADADEDFFGRDDFWASSVNVNVQF